MALSKRERDVVLDVKDEAPNPIVQDHEWPNALPNEMNRIVIAYLLTPTIEEVKELDEHFRRLENETMAPFRNAIESNILPLLNKPILRRIYQSKPTKSKWNLVENNAEKLLDGIIEQMSHLPADEQLEFLCAVCEGDWEKEEKGHFKQVKDSLKVLHKSFEESKESDVFQARIAQIIFEKLNNFISYTITHSYQDSKTRTGKINDNKTQKVKTVASAEQLLQQEQAEVNLIGRRYGGMYACSVAPIGSGTILLTEGIGDNNKTFLYLGCTLLGVGFLLLIGMLMFGCLRGRHQNQVRILQTARDRFFQPASEAKSDNNSLTESLLTPEQQAEYKEEDEESNLRLDSPRREGGK